MSGAGSTEQQGAQVEQGAGAQSTILTRTLYINITGTLSNLAMAGPSGGTWKPVDGKQIGVFGLGTEIDTQVIMSPAPFMRGVEPDSCVRG